MVEVSITRTFLFEYLAPRKVRNLRTVLVVVIAGALTVSLVPLSSTMLLGVLRFFNFTSQVFKTVWRMIRYNFKIRAKSSL